MMATKKNCCSAAGPTGNRNARRAVACLPFPAPVLVKKPCNGHPRNKRASYNSHSLPFDSGNAIFNEFPPTGMLKKSVKRESGSVLAGAAAAKVRCISSISAL
jgi:hypothetical protein